MIGNATATAIQCSNSAYNGFDPSQLNPAILARQCSIAFGSHREDKNWITRDFPFGELLTRTLSDFKRGPKDGPCMLQGALVAEQRIAKNVRSCDIMMLDHDTGETMDEIAAKIAPTGLFCVLYHTHSHLKAETEIAESKWDVFRRQAQMVSASDVEIAVAYLRTKRVKEEVLATIRAVRRAHKAGGVKLIVEHAPMHRVRSLFVLDTPFEFAGRGGSQTEAIAEWKERYTGMSHWLGLTADRSCVDPSRLMYLPRIAQDADRSLYEIRVLDGGMLSIDTIPRVKAEGDASPLPKDEFEALGNQMVGREARPQHVFKTPGLKEFLRDHAKDFLAADWMRHIAEHDIRRDQGDKVDATCPNEDGHSNADPNDLAFMAVNGSESEGGGFHMGCLHDGCKAESGGDRAWFLDMACQKYGLGVEDLLHFCPEHVEAEKADKATADKLDKMISELTDKSTSEQIDPMLELIAERELSGALSSCGVTEKLQTVYARCTGGKSWSTRARDEWKKFYREAKDRVKARAAASAAAVAEEADAIYLNWDYDKRVGKLIAHIKRQNDPDPQLFCRDGECVRLDGEPGSSVLVEAHSHSKAVYSLKKLGVKFKRHGSDDTLETPDWATTYLLGGGFSDALPPIRGIVRTPIFAPDGSLLTARGYDDKAEVYLDPNKKYLDLPPKGAITDADVATARWYIFNALRDFPFSDCFDGVEPLPVRDGSVDAGGRPLPTPGRGESSYAHALAMMLQPFVRPMIAGPCPAYFIDKSVPGTGASQLMNVWTRIFTGGECLTDTLPAGRYGDEEIRKKITASLRSRPDVIFYDNIGADTVDSPALAAALTAPEWTDRILQLSETVRLPIRNLWVLAGNNITFTGEIIRRLVPVRMDADLEDPANQRPADYWTHHPMKFDDWLCEWRAELVWACHVLIANWIDRGKVLDTEASLASFDKWAAVMGGILRDGGIPGFLDNLSDFNSNAKSAEGSDDNNEAMLAALFSHFKTDPFNLSDVLTVLPGDPINNPLPAAGITLPATRAPKTCNGPRRPWDATSAGLPRCPAASL